MSGPMLDRASERALFASAIERTIILSNGCWNRMWYT